MIQCPVLGECFWFYNRESKDLKGNLQEGSFTKDFERWMKGAVEVDRLSLRELCEGTWRDGVLLCWGPWRMCKGRLWRQASLSTGGRWEPGMGLIYRGRWMKEDSRIRASLSEGGLWGEPGGTALHWWPCRIRYVRIWKWTPISIGAPLLGSMEGRSFPRAFERRDTFLYFGKFL